MRVYDLAAVSTASRSSMSRLRSCLRVGSSIASGLYGNPSFHTNPRHAKEREGWVWGHGLAGGLVECSLSFRAKRGRANSGPSETVRNTWEVPRLKSCGPLKLWPRMRALPRARSRSGSAVGGSLSPQRPSRTHVGSETAQVPRKGHCRRVRRSGVSSCVPMSSRAASI